MIIFHLKTKPLEYEEYTKLPDLYELCINRTLSRGTILGRSGGMFPQGKIEYFFWNSISAEKCNGMNKLTF
jgi:hypothetical protein